MWWLLGGFESRKETFAGGRIFEACLLPSPSLDDHQKERSRWARKSMKSENLKKKESEEKHCLEILKCLRSLKSLKILKSLKEKESLNNNNPFLLSN